MARPRQFDEEQVLQIARELFWDAGYAATSLDDVMSATGLGKGSLYAAFGDKHQLFLQAVRHHNSITHACARELFESAPRALDALRAFVMAPVGDPSGAAARRGCLIANSTCELASSDPDFLSEARRSYDAATTLVAQCVRRAQAEGDLPAASDPVSTARCLLTAQQGLTFMGRTGMDIDALTTTAHSLVQQLLPDQ